jgi:MFS family permease
MEPQLQTNKWQIITKFSLIYSLLVIALNLILYILGLATKMNWFSTIVMLIAVLGSIYFGIISRRNNTLGGYISYGQGVGTGMLITVFASVIITIYSYVFMNYIDPDMMENIITETKKKMIEDGTSEEAIEASVGMMRKMQSPTTMAIFGFIGQMFYGLIASLIVAAFTKKEDPDSSYKSLDN